MVYYALYNHTNNVDGEVDHEDKDTVTIRLFNPYENSTSNTLGFYDYNKNTGIWTDSVTGEVLDFDDAADAHNEFLEAHNSNDNVVSPGEYFTSDADRYQYTTDFVYVNSLNIGFKKSTIKKYLPSKETRYFSLFSLL